MSDKNKTRTSITIDPDLLGKARDHCGSESRRQGRKVSFSELVSTALERLIGGVCEDANTAE